MDMSRPITTVVATSEGAVLQVLARTVGPLTGRKIHQLADSGSETGTRKVLRRLARTGLVTSQVVGASVQYTLNRDHLAANAVIELAALRTRLFDEIRRAIQGWAIAPAHASIFGSAARGDGDLDSDIDLLIISTFTDQDAPSEWMEQLGELADQVYAWSGNHLQTYELTERGLAEHIETGEPIVQDWRRDAVTVHGPAFRSFMHALGVQEETAP